MKPITRNRARAMMRAHGPQSLVFRRRVAIGAGAIAIGVVALLFADVSDWVAGRFTAFHEAYPYVPLVTTPLGFIVLVWATNRFAPMARGSGIPQVIAAKSASSGTIAALVSMKTAILKALLTLGALLCGGSIGREGPTVQLAAAVMAQCHKIMRIPMRTSMYIAGGAAGVAAAFNTPLAGIAFAIEELAAAYEQRVTLLVMTAILISGMVAQGLSGDYIYFGVNGAALSFKSALIVAPLAGALGGVTGGCFSRLLIAASQSTSRLGSQIAKRPLLAAGICGVIVAVLGVVTQLTWGTGYDPARAMIEGRSLPLWFGFAKFAATLATAVAGLPGGIFSPSLSTGAGFGNMLRFMFPGEPASAVVLLGMVAYFTGVVRAPLTAVIILAETTVSRGLMMPMLAAALIANQTSQLVCPDKLYETLARGFTGRSEN
ncbi:MULTISPECIES: chloride channel protein [Novosphingopyxis]|uniref:chloride channel protein n=1 Tax=Novosphingopyxis TaxID=2709686 RepID=UPI001650E96C|nr:MULTISPECIES: chloride channel protein [Novosphingopyxis]MBH9537813.1 chloride channel protein [Novosphingopyxis sp. YJ-S2-01]